MSVHVSVPFNPARVWSDDDLALLEQLAGLGLSSGEIGFQAGRTKASIEGMCARRGISLPGGTAESPLAKEARQHRNAVMRARAEHKMDEAALKSIREHCRMLGISLPKGAPPG